MWTHICNIHRNTSLSLSLYIYIYTHIHYICIMCQICVRVPRPLLSETPAGIGRTRRQIMIMKVMFLLLLLLLLLQLLLLTILTITMLIITILIITTTIIRCQISRARASPPSLSAEIRSFAGWPMIQALEGEVWPQTVALWVVTEIHMAHFQLGTFLIGLVSNWTQF